jgi:hypothetical protein
MVRNFAPLPSNCRRFRHVICAEIARQISAEFAMRLQLQQPYISRVLPIIWNIVLSVDTSEQPIGYCSDALDDSERKMSITYLAN